MLFKKKWILSKISQFHTMSDLIHGEVVPPLLPEIPSDNLLRPFTRAEVKQTEFNKIIMHQKIFLYLLRCVGLLLTLRFLLKNLKPFYSSKPNNMLTVRIFYHLPIFRIKRQIHIDIDYRDISTKVFCPGIERLLHR